MYVNKQKLNMQAYMKKRAKRKKERKKERKINTDNVRIT
jgi:hypothetical protein